MKRYAVVFEESAQADVRESYDWGRRTWGKHEAQQWARMVQRFSLSQPSVAKTATGCSIPSIL